MTEDDLPDDAGERPRKSRGVQSVEIGGTLLRALAEADQPMKLRDVAEAVGMPPAKAHAYLVSYRALDLVEQDAQGKYRLGPFALHLGLARLRISNAYRMTLERLPTLAERLRLMVAISVWGEHGPTIVYVEDPPERIHSDVRPGGMFMMTVTATGKAFAAFLPPAQSEPVLRAELASARSSQRAAFRVDEASYRAEVAEVRRQGHAITLDMPIPGISAAAAPVFDHAGKMQLAVTIIGPTGAIDLDPQGRHVPVLLAFTRALSDELGYRP